MDDQNPPKIIDFYNFSLVEEAFDPDRKAVRVPLYEFRYFRQTLFFSSAQLHISLALSMFSVVVTLA